jgi:hypothetical protein
LVAGYQRFRKQVFFLDDRGMNFLRNFGHHITCYISSLLRYMVQFGDGVSQYNDSNGTGFVFPPGLGGGGRHSNISFWKSTPNDGPAQPPDEWVQSEANNPFPSNATVNNHWSQTATYPVCSFYIHLFTSTPKCRAFKNSFPTFTVSSYCSYSVPLNSSSFFQHFLYLFFLYLSGSSLVLCWQAILV